MHTEAGGVALLAMCYWASPLAHFYHRLQEGQAGGQAEQSHQPRALGADIWAGWKWMRTSQVVFKMLCLQEQHGVLLLPQGEAGD